MPPYRIVKKEHEPLLQRLTELAAIRREHQRQAESDLRVACDAMRDAIEQGVPIAQIAHAYGTDRGQVYRWVSQAKQRDAE